MSRIQAKPQGKQVLPLDKQIVEIEAFPPPALWHTISNGTIQSDSRLQIVSAPGTVSGSSGNALYSGGGRIEFIINDNQRPTSSGTLIYSVFNSDQTLKFEVQVTATQIIIKNELGATLSTTAYTPTTGHIFSIYIGDFFRLNVTGIGQVFERGAPPISFPCTYTASLTTPVAGASPAIAAPTLLGDWRVNPNAPFLFSLSGGTGVVSAISATAVEYTGSTIPGDHPLTVWLAQAQDSLGIQRATSMLSTPSLIILGDREITLNPGQKIRPKTNYDKAQTLNLVTWAILSGGGTLSNGEFTAPTTPGVTILRATSTVTNSIADLTITVPAVVTPARKAFAEGEIVDWVTNLSSPAWAASAGTINPNTGLWKAPLLPIAFARITATAGGTTVTRDVEILEKFPLQPSAPLKWTRRKIVLIGTAEDRTRTSRSKGESFDAYEIAIVNLEPEELETLLDFFDRNQPGTRFIFENEVTGQNKVAYFDSDINVEADSACAIDVSFRVIEA
jgi:hypothetical protein